MNNVKKLSLSRGLNDAFPIMIGFIPIAMAFGILAKSNNFSIYETMGFSIFVYAGASQFVAINLILMKVGFCEIILTTFLLNFRHLLMSASLSRKISVQSNLKKFLYSFFITDEVFLTASLKKNDINDLYLFTLEILTYLTWIIFTFVGFYVGCLFSELLKSSINISLYAMFIALLVPSLKENKMNFIYVIISGIINVILTYIFLLPSGWSLIIAICTSTIISYQLPNGEDKQNGK